MAALVASIFAMLLLTTLNAPAQSPDPEARSFRGYIESLWPLAEKKGVTRSTFERALTNIPYDTEVSGLSRKQPEYGRPVGDYINSLVAPSRIKGGQSRMAENAKLLDAIEKKYGVPGEVLVAIWGIETSFGANQGGRSVIRSLATLAFLNYKGDFARDELLTALLILQQQHIPPERMIGSWAGAMGQPQFIPSSFMRWAVDFSGDGKRDLWTSVPDVLASIANYLRENGWRPGLPWGYQVIVAAGFRSAQEPRRFPRMGDARLPQGRWRHAADHSARTRRSCSFPPARAGRPISSPRISTRSRPTISRTSMRWRC